MMTIMKNVKRNFEDLQHAVIVSASGVERVDP
jgi:hypothetical protein